MVVNMKEIIDTVLKIGSLAGLAGIFYQIHNNRKLRPCFKFVFEGSSASFRDIEKIKYCDYIFQGIFINSSLTPNTIIRLYLTVWENRKRNSTLRFGHTVKEIQDINSKKTEYLPLRFEPKQAYRLSVTFQFSITGTQDASILSQTKKISDNFYIPKFEYEFIIEDVNGNYYDYKSSLVNRELIDLWWILPNYSKKPIRYLYQLLVIGVVFCKNIVRRIIELFGFYK